MKKLFPSKKHDQENPVIHVRVYPVDVENIAVIEQYVRTTLPSVKVNRAVVTREAWRIAAEMLKARVVVSESLVRGV